MANLKEIRTRIASVNSTMQITSAMKMVSAAKLKKAQDAITQMRPYAEKLQEILSNVSASLDASEGVYSQEREVKNVLYIAVTSNRGLCGAFNNSVIKGISQKIREEHAEVKVLSLGKKAHEVFAKSNRNTTDGFPGNVVYGIWDDLTFDNVADVASVVMKQYREGKWDKVVLVYNRFKNAASQELMMEPFLPVKPVESDEQASSAVEYIFEPSKEYIVEEMIPKSLKVQLYKAMLDSRASEHGARMTAMHKATDNASEMLKELKLHYNKARQAAITGEILEIVGGAEALNG
ncbi:MAG: ATP synthase F1 subunit gamma [Flavobacteriales bacterium]|nr:ATP synthase F1 subunit gamma [Flavobacteriales bacterium]